MGNQPSRDINNNNLEQFSIASQPKFDEIYSDIKKLIISDEFDETYLDALFEKFCLLKVSDFNNKFKSSEYLNCNTDSSEPHWFFHCNECMSKSENYIQCTKCFFNGGHIEKGHSFYMDFFDTEASCDCGTDLLDCSCKLHSKSQEVSRKELYQTIPAFVKSDLRMFIHNVFRFICQLTKHLYEADLNQDVVKITLEWISEQCQKSAIFCMAASLEIFETKFWYHTVQVLFSHELVRPIVDLVKVLALNTNDQFKLDILNIYFENYENIYQPRDQMSVQLMIAMRELFNEDIPLRPLLPLYTNKDKCLTELILNCNLDGVPRLAQFYLETDEETEDITLQHDLYVFPHLVKEKEYAEYLLEVKPHLLPKFFRIGMFLHNFRTDTSLDFQSNTYKFVYRLEKAIVLFVQQLIQTIDKHFPEKKSQYMEMLITYCTEEIISLSDMPIFEITEGVNTPFEKPFDKIEFHKVGIHYPLFRVLGVIMMDSPQYIKTVKEKLKEKHLIDMMMTLHTFRSIYNLYDEVADADIPPFTSDYTLNIDLFLYQFLIIALTPKVFLGNYFSILSGLKTSNTVLSLSEQFYYLLLIIKGVYRLVPTDNEIKYHLTQWILSKNIQNYYMIKVAYESLFNLSNFDEKKAILQEVVTDNLKSLRLEYYDRFDVYYPFYAFACRHYASDGLDEFYDHVHGKKLPVDYQIPTIELIQPEARGVYDILLNTEFSNMMFFILLSSLNLYPTIEYEDSLILEIFQQFSRDVESLSFLSKECLFFCSLASNVQQQHFNQDLELKKQINQTVEQFLSGEIDELPEDTSIIYNLIRPISFNDDRNRESILSLLLKLPFDGVFLYKEHLDFIKSAIVQTLDNETFLKLVGYTLSLNKTQQPTPPLYSNKSKKSVKSSSKSKSKKQSKQVKAEEEEGEEEEKEEEEKEEEKVETLDETSFKKVGLDSENEDEDEDDQEKETEELKELFLNLIKTEDEQVLEEEEEEEEEEHLCQVCGVVIEESCVGYVANVMTYGFIHQNRNQNVNRVLNDESVDPNYKKFLSAFLRDEIDIPIEYLPYKNDYFTLYSLYIYNRTPPNRLKSCMHKVHLECCESHDETTGYFHCGVCKQQSNMLVPLIDWSLPEKTIEQELGLFYEDMCEVDFSAFLEDKNFGALDRHLWKFIAQGVEGLELKSRLTHNLAIGDDSDIDGYYPIDQKEFDNQMLLIQATYRAIQECEVLSNGEISPLSDPMIFMKDVFTSASYCHYIEKTPLEPFLEKGVQLELFKLVLYHLMNQKVSLREMSAHYKRLKFDQAILNTLKDQIFPYLRKSALLLDITSYKRNFIALLQDYSNFDWVAQKLKFNLEKALAELDFSGMLADYSATNSTPKGTPFYGIYPAPESYKSLPSLTSLPELHIDHVRSVLKRSCKHCKRPATGICLVCGDVICHHHECPQFKAKGNHVYTCPTSPFLLVLLHARPDIIYFSNECKSLRIPTATKYLYKENEQTGKDDLFNEYITTNINYKLDRKALKELYRNYVVNA
ncbi:RING zinc finger-containing protein [Tieghemostelium lacteum]|uniref:RING zinc finger-containing protein n=1 Tax=Tieghemostelium lacteum TaxID=361077 RepID=A0A152A8G4_TIELA|nr:RING zinc finger-containing protein [Tieghemostelium lacteum]|eukprot:KYR02395.1 RING zinc finger-containing protein [Tieghemostelium lacteum]